MNYDDNNDIYDDGDNDQEDYDDNDDDGDHDNNNNNNPPFIVHSLREVTETETSRDEVRSSGPHGTF